MNINYLEMNTGRANGKKFTMDAAKPVPCRVTEMDKIEYSIYAVPRFPTFHIEAYPKNGSQALTLFNLFKTGETLNASFESRGIFLEKMLLTPKLMPTRIVHSGPATIVFWNDKTKTVVRCSENDTYDEYAAFCSALAKKLYENNSHLKTILRKVTVEQKKKEKTEKKQDDAFVYPVLESLFHYRGYTCYVLMQTHGHRCGYVEIPKGDKYFNVEYGDIDVECHGGLTYSRSELCYDGVNKTDSWFIGFDCAHYNDCPDYDTALRYFKGTKAEDSLMVAKRVDERIGTYDDCGSVKGEVYVRDQCKHIVDQLKEDLKND